MVPGIGIASAGLVMFFLLAPAPEAAGFQPEQVRDEFERKKTDKVKNISLCSADAVFQVYELHRLYLYVLVGLIVYVTYLIITNVIPKSHLFCVHDYVLWQDAESADEKEEENKAEVKEEKAISIFGALKIPGVVEFSLW